MRGQTKLGGCALCAWKGLVEFYSPWKEREGAHTRLGLETIKVSGIDLKRREIARVEEGST